MHATYGENINLGSSFCKANELMYSIQKDQV